MRRKRNTSKPKATEEHYFRRYLDEIVGPSEPTVKIYRIEPNGKQVCVDCLFVEQVVDFSKGLFKFSRPDDVLENIRHQFGPGRYLLRTVYSNGRFGPSRRVDLG
jgi:hypothetical protein